MSDEAKIAAALALVNEVRASEIGVPPITDLTGAGWVSLKGALLLAIERHEADMQRVSDAILTYEHKAGSKIAFNAFLDPFIIKPPVDPLVEVFKELGWKTDSPRGDRPTRLRAALSRHDLSIVKGGE